MRCTPTLRQAVEFRTRGGNHFGRHGAHVDPDIGPPGLAYSEIGLHVASWRRGSNACTDPAQR